MRGRSPIHLSKAAVIAVLATALSGAVSLADKLVDPSKVAPEFREAAEKRRAEQLKIISCSNQSKIANIAARDQLKFMQDCVDRTDVPPSDVSSSTKK